MGNKYSLRFLPTPVLAKCFQQRWAQRHIAILAALAFTDANDHALAVDVLTLQMSQFAASHAGGVQRHQQRSPEQCPAGVDQARDFVQAEHRRQPVTGPSGTV